MTVEAVADNVQPDAPGQKELDLLVAETAAEARTHPDLPEGAVIVPLYGRDEEVLAELAVLHPDDWPSSANEDVNGQRYYSWGSKVMATDDDSTLWRALDPTNRQAIRFINDWTRLSGNDQGKGGGQKPSSNGMPRR